MKMLIAWIVLAMPLAACAPKPTALHSPNLPPPSATQIIHAIDAWPAEYKRQFFATIRVGDHRMTAQGQIDLHPNGESRLTATTENGLVIIDATIKGKQVQILRRAPGIWPDALRAIAADSVLALSTPKSPDAKDAMVYSYWHETYIRSGFLIHDRYKFVGPDGRLQAARFFRGPWDPLHVQVLRYTPEGAPLEVIFFRPRYWYMVSLTFTDKDTDKK